MTGSTKAATPLDGARILLSNDDGVNAPGLKVLARIAKQLARDIWISAPELEQSGAGHSLTMRRPLRIRKEGVRKYAVDGTPTDAVLLGIRQLLKEKRPTLLLSGVNRGSNLGEDVTYSGTVAAAMEATLLHVPAIALSLHVTPGQPIRWDTVEAHAPALIASLVKAGWPENVLLNVNFPDCAPDAVAGIEVTRQGRRKIGDQLGERTDMRGERYYWIGPMRNEEKTEEGSDLHAIYTNRIAVTPLHMDLTHDATARSLATALATAHP